MYEDIHLRADRSMESQFAHIGRKCGFGPSPGGASAILGISRQSVYRAIMRGALKAYRVYYPAPDNKDPMVFIDAASLDLYKRLREGPQATKHGRIPYRSTAVV